MTMTTRVDATTASSGSSNSSGNSNNSIKPFFSIREVDADRIERQNAESRLLENQFYAPISPDDATHATAVASLDGGMNQRKTIQFTSPMASNRDRQKALEEHRREAAEAAVQDSSSRSGGQGMRYECCTNFVIFPWNPWYRAWWAVTVVAAVSTAFLETYLIAFTPAGITPFRNGTAKLEFVFLSIFLVDMAVHLNLAYYGDNDTIVYGKKEIAQHYLQTTFVADVVGIMPFYFILLVFTGELRWSEDEDSRDTSLAQWLSLVRMVRLIRFYKVKEFVDRVRYDANFSLIGLTLLRNFGVALLWAHSSACAIYFIARKYNFDEDDTWIGPPIKSNGDEETDLERYVTSLYWSILTLTSVGYGDYTPVNVAEKVWAMIFMLLNIILNSWIIGSITLLIVKNDEKAGTYRKSLQDLNEYIQRNSLDDRIHERLKMQLTLDFHNREISDEHILSQFPSEVRRKVLRRLYLPWLSRSGLMHGLRQQFVDDFLTACRVEIFSPGEKLLRRGIVSPDLYFIVDGTVQQIPQSSEALGDDSMMVSNVVGNMPNDAEYAQAGMMRQKPKELSRGNFINDIGFLTESPEVETVRTKRVCKTLTMSRAAYRMLSEDHPGSVGQMLQNLLFKVEQDMKDQNPAYPRADLFKQPTMLRVSSVLEPNTIGTSSEKASVTGVPPSEAALTSVQDLIKMHMNKLKDDHTTRFLFAASRGDVDTITFMYGHGFDPNSSDYDNRTALMVAATKGNKDAVAKLLECKADPNVVDTHGTSALYEATRKGHETTMGMLLEAGGGLCMDDYKAASALCQAISYGDMTMLKRLLKAKINVNAVDYDKRAAVHIAAADRNIKALQILLEHGADLTLQDRWGNTAQDEAREANAEHIIEFLKNNASIQ